MLQVVGAGVGRTGTHSLKLALEQLLGGTCHHMVEVFGHPEELPAWIDAANGRSVDWTSMMQGYTAQVDWPGASFWPELSAANPDALVILSVREPDAWYTSCSNTIFEGMTTMQAQGNEWMDSMRSMMHERFSDDLTNPDAMKSAFEQHNDAVRAAIPKERLLEWTAADGWEPICDRLGLPVPSDPFPKVNSTKEFRELLGMPYLST